MQLTNRCDSGTIQALGAWWARVWSGETGRWASQICAVARLLVCPTLACTIREQASVKLKSSDCYRRVVCLNRFANLMKRRQIREALGSEREALLSQLTEQTVSGSQPTRDCFVTDGVFRGEFVFAGLPTGGGIPP